MSDLIDRQALLKQIDIDSDGEPGYYGDTWKFIDTIKSMPPTELSTNLADVDTDCISRQAAISAICNACGKIDCDKMDKCEKLQLPPANCSEFPNNSDTISRQAAIDALGEEPPVWYDGEDEIAERNQWKRDIEAIKQLPPIQPKKGKWIKLDMHRGMADHKCTVCKQECYVPTCMGEPMYAFCPNCGADMRQKGENSESN